MINEQKKELAEWVTQQIIGDSKELTIADAKKITWCVALIMNWEDTKGLNNE